MLSDKSRVDKAFSQGLVKEKWKVMIYYEEIKASQSAIIDDVGEMMTRGRYLSWATSPEGGKTMKEAEADWSLWEADPIASGLFTTNVSNIRKFRVVVKELVTFRAKVSQSRKLQMQGVADKKFTEDAVLHVELLR